jgi:predicted nucleotidyltransferase
MPAKHDAVSEETFWRVFDRAIATIAREDLPFLVIGGIPTAHYGYPTWDAEGEDIDLLLSEENAEVALTALQKDGCQREKSEHDWMFKASSEDVTIDLIFRPGDVIELDEEMMERARSEEFGGRAMPMASPEDIVVMHSASYQEDAPIRLKNILGILSRNDLDWDYLLWRTKEHGRLRLLSFLVYADSKDILLPRSALKDFMSAEGFLPQPASARTRLASSPLERSTRRRGHR